MVDHGAKETSTDGAAGFLILRSGLIGQFLLHRESSIRLAAFSLLVTAASTTKPITSAAVQAILMGLRAVHAESDAFSRGEIMAISRRLMARLKGGVLEDLPGSVQETKADNPATPGEYTATRAFMKRYVNFLQGDLRPEASYACHITALRVLSIILEGCLDARIDMTTIRAEPENVNPWRFNMDIFNPGLMRSLVDLLLDPFDDVRATSLAILKMFPREMSMSRVILDNLPSKTPRLMGALSRAERLASNTSRADHADAVARLYNLLFFTASTDSLGQSGAEWWRTKMGVVNSLLKKLEAKLSLPGGLFNASMRDAPLHGFLSALRYALEPATEALLINPGILS